MKRGSYVVWLLALLLAGPLPALAADPIAEPDSPIGRAGQVILDAVASRTYAEAFAKSRSPTNPFGIDLEKVAAAAGASSAGDVSGGLATEGHLSILPQFNTPEAKFGTSATTPAIIPFAVMVAGKCLGGYVTGYPSADRVYSADMLGRECSATAIGRGLAGTYPLAARLSSNEASGHSAGGTATQIASVTV